MRIFWRLPLLALLLALCAGHASARLVLVVHPDSPIQKLSKPEVINIYMGRYSVIGGSKVNAIDLSPSHEERAQFYRQLVNKTTAEMNAYWSRLIFSGKTEPPLQVQTTQQLIRMLKEDKNALGYLDSSQIGTLRIVFEFPPEAP